MTDVQALDTFCTWKSQICQCVQKLNLKRLPSKKVPIAYFLNTEKTIILGNDALFDFQSKRSTLKRDKEMEMTRNGYTEILPGVDSNKIRDCKVVF